MKAIRVIEDQGNEDDENGEGSSRCHLVGLEC
jgi:hypothetical protein